MAAGDTLVTEVPVVKVNGQPAFTGGLTYARVRRSLNAVGHLHVRIDADDADSAKAAVGKPITVALADSGGTVGANLFDGEIVSVGLDVRVERSEILIDAYDKSHKLMRQAPTVTHLEANPKKIIEAFARAAGLQPDVESLPANYTVFHQYGTAGRCLDDWCRAYGAEWWVEGPKLHVRKITTSPPDSGVKLTAGTDLRDFSARFTAAEQVDKVSVRGWNVREKTAIASEAAGLNTSVTGKPSKVTAVPGQKPAQRWSPMVVDAQTAGNVAAGATASASLGVLTGRGECAVNGRIVAGKTISIDGVGPEWNGKYYVTGVEHVLGIDQPFLTRFSIGGRDQGSLVDLLGDAGTPTSTQLTNGLTIGIVTNNDDNARGGLLNRVKVKFPYLSDSDESQWARVIVPGGGKDRGLVLLPEVDDEVLVGFENGDLAKPVVLGGLWNGKDLPPVNTSNVELRGSDGKVASRQWVSREKHRIVLSDTADDQHINIELADKKTSIKLTKGKGITVTATDQPIELTNGKATLRLAENGDIVIKGAKITIEAQQDFALEALSVKALGKTTMELEGKQSFTAKGSMVGVEATGITEVKGQMVKIN